MSPLKILMALGCLVSTSNLNGQDLDSLILSHQQRLETSLKTLAHQREAFRNTIVPQSQKVRELKREEQQWRSKLENLQSVQDSKTLGLEDLKHQVASKNKEMDFFETSLLREFMIEERSSLPTYDKRLTTLRELDLRIESGELTQAQAFQQQLQAIVEATDQLKWWMGGSEQESKAITSSGEWREGTVVDLGPEQFFFSTSSTGRLQESPQGQSKIIENQTEALQAWKLGAITTLPLDVTDGLAQQVMAQKKTLWEHIQRGGLWVFPIMGFALMAACTALFKSLSLYTTRMSAPQVGIKLAQLLESKQQEEALTLAQQQPQPCRNMWTQVLKLGLVEPELSDEVMNEVMLETQPKLERFLSLINVTAAIAPLLGLLGTVTGIIKTFEMMAIFGAGDPKPLIGGISEALITTELGLILAIPALLMSALLSRKAQSLLSKMERSAVAFSNARLTHQQKTSGESSPS